METFCKHLFDVASKREKDSVRVICRVEKRGSDEVDPV